MKIKAQTHGGTGGKSQRRFFLLIFEGLNSDQLLEELIIGFTDNENSLLSLCLLNRNESASERKKEFKGKVCSFSAGFVSFQRGQFEHQFGHHEKLPFMSSGWQVSHPEVVVQNTDRPFAFLCVRLHNTKKSESLFLPQIIKLRSEAALIEYETWFSCNVLNISPSIFSGASFCLCLQHETVCWFEIDAVHSGYCSFYPSDLIKRNITAIYRRLSARLASFKRIFTSFHWTDGPDFKQTASSVQKYFFKPTSESTRWQIYMWGTF